MSAASRLQSSLVGAWVRLRRARGAPSLARCRPSPLALVPLPALLLLSAPAWAQSASIVQRFVGPLNFAAPIVGSIGALAVIGGIVSKAAGQQPAGNMAIGGGVLFIIATFLMKSYASWATLFFG